ncbi:hypothetical protein V1506DRAFT_546744 [Lipomyces tetrasporus]
MCAAGIIVLGDIGQIVRYCANSCIHDYILAFMFGHVGVLRGHRVNYCLGLARHLHLRCSAIASFVIVLCLKVFFGCRGSGREIGRI